MAGACGVCYEVDPEAVRTEERLAYVGQGMGSYSQVSNMEMVGRGRGDFEKEKYVVAEGYRLKAGFLGCFCLLSVLALVLGIGFGNNWWIRHRAPPVNECSMLTAVATPAQKQICCSQGFRNFCAPPQRDLVRQVDQYYYHVKNIKENHLVPVPIPPPPRKVITQKVMVHTHAFDCDQSVDDWKHIWSTRQQRYCCYLRQIGCHTKVEYRPHYHTITKTEPVNVPVPVPVPAPPAQVITHVKNVPIHDAPQIVRVPTPGAPISVPRYVHQKHYVPAPEPSPPQYRNVPVPMPVKEPGKVIKVPTPLPPQTVVRNKVIYKTKHLRVQHIYDCAAGYSNWNSGWSSAKKSWRCAHEQKGCPGSHSGHLTKTVVTGVTQHEGPTYYHHLGTVPYHHIHHIHHYHTYHTHSYANYDNSDGLSTVIHSNSGDTLNGIGSGYTGSTSGSFGTGSFDTDTGSLSDASWHGGDLTNEDVMAPRRLQAIAAEALPSGASIAGHYVDGSDASIGQSHYIDGTGGATRVIHSSYADSADSGTASSYADGILHGGHYVDSASTGIHDGQYTDGSSSLSSLGDLVHEGHYGSSSGQILHDDWSTIHPEEHVHHVHVTHYTVPAPVPQPVEPQTHVHEVVRRHYGTVYRKVPVNHYVHVKMPQQPPIVHTVKVMAPAKTYSCNGVGDQPDPSWSDKHTRWCCYKYGTFCPKTVIDKNIYHTVVKKQPVKVPVPEPMPTHPPIVKTIHHTYHVPSPPRYVHVPVPGPTVVKNVVVPENVPVPVPEPPQVINVKKPYTVHVPGKNHYVHVPVPSPPHIVTKYHTHWNTVVDHGDTATYDCHAGFSDWHSLWSHAKQRWCCSNKFVGCPGSWHGAIAHTTHVTHVHHIHHYHSGSYPGGWHSHSWSSSDGYHPLKK